MRPGVCPSAKYVATYVSRSGSWQHVQICIWMPGVRRHSTVYEGGRQVHCSASLIPPVESERLVVKSFVYRVRYML